MIKKFWVWDRSVKVTISKFASKSQEVFVDRNFSFMKSELCLKMAQSKRKELPLTIFSFILSMSNFIPFTIRQESIQAVGCFPIEMPIFTWHYLRSMPIFTWHYLIEWTVPTRKSGQPGHFDLNFGFFRVKSGRVEPISWKFESSRVGLSP